ncbi:DUF3180 domain-containing protein [Micrococcus sp.]|uniref:DUF3180 domain-containing protein n=1 Tax=Micrococcus sp. TaxID=1271 RepID=UPI002A91660E|nr:DUF3180 domain-containing protein [Micrococcus sp.]MDY6054652.1 DUF3180 domain-containing protein [Micrococcus sp.]
MISLLSPRPLVVLLVAAAAGVAAALTAPALGAGTPVVGLSGLVTVAAVAVLSLALGWRVRQDRARPPARRMDPLAAARTLVLGQAAGFAGAALAGWHAGAAVPVALRAGLEAPTVREALVMAAGSLVLLAVGALVERWCRIPPEEEGPPGPGGQNGGVDAAGTRRRPEAEGGYAHGRH